MLKEQLEGLNSLKATRDQTLVSQALDALEKAAGRTDQNLLTLAIEAARVRATLGEISAALEKP